MALKKHSLETRHRTADSRQNPFLRWTAIFALATLAACGGSGGDSAGGSTGGGGGGALPGNGEQYGSGPAPGPDPSGAATSADLIKAALTNGDLSQEQALLYGMYADFDDPRLPAQYKGDDVGLIEGHAHEDFVAYVASVGLDNVSQQTQDAVLPFFLPPYYSGSWWAQKNGSTTRAKSAAVPARNGCQSCSPLTSWKSVDGPHVVVWYESAQEATDKAKAEMLRDEFENTIWPKLTSLMGRTPLSDTGTGGALGMLWTETDGRLDIALTDIPGGKEGVTMPSTWRCEASPVYITMDRGLSNQGLIAQTAHEFMHALQYSIDVAAKCLGDYHTSQEATAAWATNYVYPKNDWEHKYAKYYLEGEWYEEPYDSREAPDGFRYGAYVFPLFLETQFGASIIRSIWDNTTQYNQELFAIDAALQSAGSSLHKIWPKFVAANWNRDGILTYLKADALSTNASIDSGNKTNWSMDASGTVSLPIPAEVKHAAASYYHIKLNDKNLRSLTILNGWKFKLDTKEITDVGKVFAYTGLSALERQGLSLQVYLKINGTWQTAPADLSNAPWTMVCRDDPAGKIEEMILMYGNSEMSPNAPNYGLASARVKHSGLLATSVGCRDWTGSLSMKETEPSNSDSQSLALSNVRFKNILPTAAPPAGFALPDYPLGDGEEVPQTLGWVYRVAEGTAKWDYSRSYKDKPPCNGSRTFAIAGNIPNMIPSGAVPSGSLSRTLLLSQFLVNVLQADLVNGMPMTECEWSPYSMDVAVAPNVSGVKISADGLTIRGTGTDTNSGNVTGTWTLKGETN